MLVVKMDTNLVGTITEMRCKLYFTELGYIVSTPETPVRYDFIIDTGTQLLKVQAKTCRANEEFIVFATCSNHNTKTRHIRSDYKSDGVDYFCTWHDGECYLVPVSECGKAEKRLRLIPTKNGQVKNISFAKDYIASEVLASK